MHVAVMAFSLVYCILALDSALPPQLYHLSDIPVFFLYTIAFDGDGNPIYL
jgi:hypothetical protein